MITAIVLSIVIHAQMTVPWIGGSKAAAAPAIQIQPIVLSADGVIVLLDDQVTVLQ